MIQAPAVGARPTDLEGSAERRLPTRGAALVWSVVVAELAFVVAVFVLAGSAAEVGALQLLFIGIVASMGGVGALVATRQPLNPVGWLLWVAGFLVALAISGADFVRFSQDAVSGGLPGTILIAWLQGVTFMPAMAIVTVFVPLFFPDGRLLSRRWRWVVALAVMSIGVLILPGFAPGPLEGTALENPLAIQGITEWRWLLDAANLVMVLVLFPLTALSCVNKYRRGPATVRQQVKWFGAAVAWTLLWLLVSITIPPLSDVGWVLGITGLMLIPVAIGIAILRYRLYEIDRVVSRTVSWAVVTGVLLAVFGGLVVGLQAVLAPVTSESTLAVAASTLAVAATFQPLRRRVQRAVDRRFDRARYDGDRLALVFADRLRDEIGLDEIAGELLRTVDAAVRPARTGLWLRTDAPRRSS